MPTLICYDITADGLRTKLGKKILESGLDRINKSVYLATISESSLTSLEKELATLLQSQGQTEDSLIVLPLTPEAVKQMRIYGDNGLDKAELTGDKSTLLI